MRDNYAITIDVDWAPDWAILEVAKMLIENQVKATWFATHDSPEIRKLDRNTRLFEVGLHPNFNPNSTQGETPEEIMMYMKAILPHAKTVRTHTLVQSNSLLRMIREDFDMLYDVSLFLPDTPHITPHEAYFSNSGKGLLRFPYYWEDDREMYKPIPCFSFAQKKYHVIGLNILCFHVIHIILNSSDMTNYFKCKEAKNLIDISATDIEPYINDGQGTRTLFREFMRFFSDGTNPHSQTISDLAQRWRDGT